MRAGVPLVLCCILVWILSIEAAVWSNWTDLTICNAKPCRCEKSKEREKCEKGKKIQVRFCIRKDGDTEVCKWRKNGAMKITSCKNAGVCPGWSKWQLGKCDCEENLQLDKRYCKNPPPIHPDVLCIMEDSTQALEEDSLSYCNCTEEEQRETTPAPTTTTTTTTMEPTTPLPCCVEDSYNYDTSYDTDDDVDGDESFGGGSAAATTTEKPSAADDFYYDMYDELKISEQPTCRPCNNSNESGVIDYGDLGNYSDYQGGSDGDNGNN